MTNHGTSCEHEADRGFAIRFFGPLSVEVGGRRLGPRDLGGTRPKQVLEILLAARGHRVPTDRIADQLWGKAPPEKAVGSIQTFVSVLRRHLTSDKELARRLVVTEIEAYRFATSLIAFDLDRFDELHDRSRREPTHLARCSLEEALALARGEVLEDEPYAAWAQQLRGVYQGRVLGAHLDAADAALAEVDYAEALVRAEAGVLLDRFSERAHRTQMLALYALGRQHEALEVYRHFRRRLDEELGLGPSAETRALEAAILRQEDVRSLLPRPIGLAPAEAGTVSLRLLGRTKELDTLERAVRQALEGSFSVLRIEGEAGLGKTRLLDELSTRLAGVRIGRASASDLERHLPYVPLAGALRDALGGSELTDARPPALRRILPELEVDDLHEFAEIDVLESLVALVASHAPLVLLLDDMQWADASTLTALRYLQNRRAGVAAAVVTAVGETSPDDPVRLLHADTRVRLGPLSAGELAPLGMPDLHEATGGNPRLVAGVIAKGADAELATALSEVLVGLCRAEGPRVHRILLAASVLEQPFDPELLATLVRVDTADLLEELDLLCERGILRVDGFSFRFGYELMREVLFVSVSPARRRLLRERAKQQVVQDSSRRHSPAVAA